MAIDFAKLSAPYFTLYGETVVYTKGSGATRSITAVVDRQPRSPLPMAADVVRPRFVVYVRNSATLGILQTELERSTDTLTFAGDLGASASAWSILKVSSQDAGVLELECA